MSDEPAQSGPTLSPEQQVGMQISIGKVKDWVGGVFGRDWESEVGGGGAGGEYVFADLAELDEIIKQWEAQRDAIRADGDQIRQAIGFVMPPADDEMSVRQADATTDSLNRLLEHNTAMFDYAQAYVEKLKAARGHTAATDSDNASTLTRTDGAK